MNCRCGHDEDEHDGLPGDGGECRTCPCNGFLEPGAYVHRLQNIVGNVLLGAWDQADDNEPERTIAQTIYEFLRSGQEPIGKLFGERTIAAAIEALGE